jgi:small subunit ribosomal protein S1
VIDPRRSSRPEKEHGPHTLRVWPGTVVGLFGDDVFVELGPRMQGVISKRAFAEPPAVGASFEFTLRGQEEGLWALALREQKSLATWEDMEQGSLVHARVIRLASGGLELKIGPLHAFLPKSHSGLARDEDPVVLVGKTLVCEVIEVDRERQRVVVSRKLVLQRERESERQRQVGALKPGEVVQGRVTRIEPYGVFVALARGVEGMVHVSNLAHERPEHPADLVKEGDVIELKVLAIKQGGKRISLGLKQMVASPWKDLERALYVDQIVEGRVTRLVDYGAFVAIRAGVEGLLHVSDTGLRRDQPLASLLAKGQKVSVRVQSLDCEAERLSLSLLHRNGKALAPDEAANAASFAELARAKPAEHLELPLGSLLLDALRRSTGQEPR